MISINFDFKDFEDYANKLHARVDQVPYALARALNDAAFYTREKFKETWASSVEVKSPSFIGAALHIERATKYNLQVEIYDQIALQRGRGGHLYEHAYGGQKQAAHQHLAIPLKSWVKYGARGVRKDMLPEAIIRSTPKRALRITDTGIFVGEGGELKMKYKLQPTAQIKADVPFVEVWQRVMNEQVEANFTHRLLEAMATAR